MSISSVSQGIKALIATELSAYNPVLKANDNSGIGTPLSREWHEKMVVDFSSSLIEPKATKLILEDGSSTECWAISKEIDGYQILYVPTNNEFCAAMKVSTGLKDINIRGDAIGCFGAI